MSGGGNQFDALLGGKSPPASPIPIIPAAPARVAAVSPALLPDGSQYVAEDLQFQGLANSVLLDLLKRAEFHGGHTPVLRLVLDLNVACARDRLLAKQADDQRDISAATAYRDQYRKNSAELVKLYDKLQLLTPKDEEESLLSKVQELKTRVPEFIRRHGMSRAYACPGCGHIAMVYALFKIDLEVDWDEIERLLRTKGIPVHDIHRVLAVLRDANLPMSGKIIHHPFSHPFVNDADFPIWSPELRDMMQETCSCGRPKITMDDAARILRISPAGWDQLMQEDNRRRGKPPIDNLAEDVKPATEAIFRREGTEADGSDTS